MPFETATALLLMGQAVSAVDLPPPPPPPPGARPPVVLTVEPEADDEKKKPKTSSDVGPAPVPPRDDLDVERPRHGEGFFFRQSVGVAFGALTLTTPLADGPEVETKLEAGLLTHELLLGGSPVRGFNLGARASLAFAPGAGVVGGSSIRPDTDPLVFVMGTGFIDVYPMPEEGLHLFGAGGMATVNNAKSLGEDEFVGAAWSFGIGYEFWVSTRWSMGVTTRIDGIWAPGSDAASSGSTLAPSLEALMPGLQVSISYSSGH